MKITLREIYIPIIKQELSILSNTDVSMKAAYKVAKLINKITPEFNLIEKFRVDLVNKYGVSDDKGNINVPSEKLEEFGKEFNDFLNTEIELDIEPLSEDLFDKGIIKTSILLDLGKFISY